MPDDHYPVGFIHVVEHPEVPYPKLVHEALFPQIEELLALPKDQGRFKKMLLDRIQNPAAIVGAQCPNLPGRFRVVRDFENLLAILLSNG